jgi:rhamnosyl/mannosyltransferase
MFYQPIANKLLRRTTAIICTSPNYRESSRELTEHREKTHVIPLGVDLESFDRTPELDAASQRRREACGGSAVVLCVGRLVPYKGFDVLVRAMKDVDAILLIVGSGPEGPALKAMSRALGIAGRIRFLGDLDDIELRACYLASDVVAMTSVDRSEAFGLVQLEAMASERAIVNTQIDGSGVPWVSRDGETGLTVPPRDTDRLARALSLLLADEGLRRRFGRQGRLRVEREFTGRVMARKTFELYERLTRNDT